MLSSSQDRIDGITIQARQFQDAGHFDAENIKKKQEALVARYEALKEPMIARKQKLADSLRLQQLFRDVEDEETWIREKEPIAASTNRGQCSSSRWDSSSTRAMPLLHKGDMCQREQGQFSCTGTLVGAVSDSLVVIFFSLRLNDKRVVSAFRQGFDWSPESVKETSSFTSRNCRT